MLPIFWWVIFLMVSVTVLVSVSTLHFEVSGVGKKISATSSDLPSQKESIF